MAKLLFVSPTAELGGPTNCLLMILKYVAREYQVTILTPTQGAFPDALDEQGIHNHIVGPHGLNRKAIPWMYHFITDQRFDLVYGNGYNTAPRNALVAAKLARKPFIWHIHEILKPAQSSRRKWGFLRYADIIIAVSQASAASIKHYISHNKLYVVYNGIELDDYQIEAGHARKHVRNVLDAPEDSVVIINIGVLCERKGQAKAVQVAKQVLEKHPEVRFAFLGSLETEPEYAQAALKSAQAYQSQIQFLGYRNDIPKFLAGSDVLLHTARSDPNPRAVIEAMGAGIPVIAFGVDGVTEQVLDKQTGYLANWDDVDTIASRLIQCIRDQASRRKLGSAGQKRVLELFSAERTSLQVNTLISKLLSMSNLSKNNG